MQSVILRSFRKSDASAVTDLFRKVYGDCYVQPQVYLPCMINQNHAAGRWHSLVAVADDQMLGHATLVRAKGSCIAELALTVVDPDTRGQSIATRLSQHLLIHAQALGCQGVTIKQVTHHDYTQRMAARLGFHNIGVLPDYARSPYGESEPVTLLIGYQPIDGYQRAIPALAWPVACRDFMLRQCAVFGTQPTASPWIGAPVHLEQNADRYDGTFKELDASLLTQLERLPAHWMISIRLRLAQGFDTAEHTLSNMGFVFTGLAPDDRGGGWLALFHRGYQPRPMALRCTHMQDLHDRMGIQSSSVETTRFEGS
ncbi:GNAT family N-acetyltransferase [Pseudomonas sp. TWP3-2]|uniref:GNAT family N-acetyltransferase n=1 Tax=Pseudomonas sp. TWP3-2 TaxID=2804574 RepID=UPI003CE9DF24